MKFSDIRVDSYVDILIKRKGYNYRIVSEVIYTDENCIGVEPIASTQRLFKFHDDDRVDVVYREKDRYWRWENVKAGIATCEDGTRMHVFSVTGRAATYNRRTQFRLDAGFEIPLKYEVNVYNNLNASVTNRLPEIELEEALNGLDENYRELECRAYLKDLSEGGASIETDVKLEKGCFISFTIESDVGTVFLRGVIVRCTEDRHGYFDYRYGVSFIETSRNYINYFYSQQRKLLYESSSDKSL